MLHTAAFRLIVYSYTKSFRIVDNSSGHLVKYTHQVSRTAGKTAACFIQYLSKVKRE